MNSTHRIARRPLALAVAIVLNTVGAHAAIITVTDAGDAGTSTSCTLRQALVSSSSEAATGSCVVGSGTDTISFATPLQNSTISLTQGQLVIASSVAITGSGQTIDAGGNSPGVQIDSTYYSNTYSNAFSGPTTVSLSNLTITNGATNYCPAGGIFAGGCNVDRPTSRPARNAIPAHTQANSSITLTGVNVVNNSATTQAGGIFVTGTNLNINQSTVSGNTLTTSRNYAAGGIYATRGAYDASDVTITNSTISNNTVSGSTSSYLAGAMYLYASNASLINTTITGNTASGQNNLGGGIQMNSAPYNNKYLQLNDCTVSGNSASSTSNSTDVAGAALLGSYGVGVMNLNNTIIAGNTGVNPDILVDNAANGSTLTANASLLGSALSTNYSGNGNIFTNNPGVAALANNGGPSKTMALQPGSLAVDAGNNTLIPGGVSFDQRGTGFIRIFNGTVDIGAYESQSAIAAVSATAPTPALSTWALTLLGGLLAWFGLVRKRESS